MKSSTRRWLLSAALALGLTAPAMAQNDLSQGLVVYYGFEETSGATVADTSGSPNVNNGDVVGQTMDLATTAGQIGNAYYSPKTIGDFISIDGTPGNAARDASLPSDLLFGTVATGNDFTISMWLKFPVASTTNQVTWGNMDWNRTIASGWRDGVGFLHNTNGGQGTIFRSNADETQLVSLQRGSQPPLKHWDLYTISVKRHGSMVYYLNGRQVGSATDTVADATSATKTIGDPTVPFILGQNAVPTMTGIIGDDVAFDDFAVWRRALNAEEVARIYKLGTSASPTGVKAGATAPWLTASIPAFKSQNVNSLSPQTITVIFKNPGATNATISALTANKGSFASDGLTLDLGSVTLPKTLAGGTSISVQLTWTPAATVGTRDFSLDITSDDPLLASVNPLNAAVTPNTLAWWRFENGVDGNPLARTDRATVFQVGVPDSSGMGNALEDYANTTTVSIYYSSAVPPVVTGPNSLSGLSASGNRGLFTWTAGNPTPPVVDIEKVILGEWTIEAFIQPSELGSNKTFVGRDGRDPIGGARAPLYFKMNDGLLRCEYTDASGTYHNITGTTTMKIGDWYYVAVRSDGTNLKLYLADLSTGDAAPIEDATLDMVATDHSTNTAFAPMPDATPNAVPSPRTSWSLFRGYYAGGDTDRFHGNIDEVRISAKALSMDTESLLQIGVPVQISRFSVE